MGLFERLLISFQRNETSIAEESALDGLYFIRSNLHAEALDAPDVVRQYKTLGRVEKAFRVIKSGLEVRLIYHHLANRVRAHIFLCMLAYYVEWEMRARLAPLLYAEEASPAKRQSDPVARLLPSQESLRKTGTRQSKSGFILHSFSTLLQDLSSLVRNRCSLLQDTKHPVSFFKFTQPTPFQTEAFRLLGIPCTQ